MARGSRQRRIADYRKLPPRSTRTRCTSEDKLYAVDVLETDSANNRVRVHYRGYSSKHDEWKDLNEVVAVGEMPDSDCDAAGKGLAPLAPFSLYHDLAFRIMAAFQDRGKAIPA